MPCILACGGLDLGDQRLHALVRSGLERALAAVEDLDAAEFLPRGRILSAANVLSVLCGGGRTRPTGSGRQEGADGAVPVPARHIPCVVNEELRCRDRLLMHALRAEDRPRRRGSNHARSLSHCARSVSRASKPAG